MLTAVAAFSAPALLAAQQFRLSGRVLAGSERDSTPLPGVWAVLHKVSMTGGAPIDSLRTGRNGRYAFRIAKPDTGSILLVSVTWRGITYFAQAVVPRGQADTAETLVVYDTSSTRPPITLAQRHIVVRSRAKDGTRRVLELLELANDGALTRITNDSTRPVWGDVLPHGAVQLEIGESDVSQDAIAQRGDSIVVTAPIPPGRKQLLFTYVLPATVTHLDVPVIQPIRRLDILLEDTTAVLQQGKMAPHGTEQMEGARFKRWEAANLAPGGAVIFALPGSPISPRRLWIPVVAFAAVALGAALLFWSRRERVPVNPEALAAHIAALDRAFQAHEAPSTRERRAYTKRRAALKHRLEGLLAAKKDAR